MTAREHEAGTHHERFAYLSSERSERTGGHEWTERVVETESGPVRLLVAEDGKPLSAERIRAERRRLAETAAHPERLACLQQAGKAEELRARALLDKLPAGFLLENVRLDQNVWSLDFRPDPGYSPSSIEDRILHGMSGSMKIDAGQLRLIHLEGHLDQRVSFGYGLLATLRPGSSFLLDKQEFEGTWRPVHVVTDFHGKAILFKAINHSTQFRRTEFQHLDPNLTVAQAVSMAENLQDTLFFASR